MLRFEELVWNYSAVRLFFKLEGIEPVQYFVPSGLAAICLLELFFSTRNAFIQILCSCLAWFLARRLFHIIIQSQRYIFERGDYNSVSPVPQTGKIPLKFHKSSICVRTHTCPNQVAGALSLSGPKRFFMLR